MKLLLPCLAALLAPWPLCAKTLVLATEPYPPFTVIEKGEVSGGGITAVRRIMEGTGQDYRIEILPWARGMALAQTQDMRCIFATARTPERSARFKWVEPLMIVRSYLVTVTGSGVQATTLEEAKRYTVGTHRTDYSEALLRAHGFPHIDLASSFDVSLGKLLNRRIDILPITEESFDTLVAEGKPLEKLMPFSEERLGIACNLHVPDDLIAAMQANLDAMNETGELRRILLPEPAKQP